MPRAGPRKIHHDSLEFKLKAVKLRQLKGVEVQSVADALEIHPFMLSRWRWYLAAVLGQYSRRLLAWRLGTTRDARRTRAVVDAARRRRRPPAGLIVHSDRGSEYLGTTVRQRLIARGVRQRLTRGGAPGEHAHMESFFHSLKADLVHGRQLQSATELRQQLRQYLRFYNHQRLHSALGYRSPVDYERGAA